MRERASSHWGNITIEGFPDTLAAGAFGHARRDLLVVPEALKQDVKVDFS